MSKEITIPEHDRFLAVRLSHGVVRCYLNAEASMRPSSGFVAIVNNEVFVNASLDFMPPSRAREWSELIAYACDIADANGGQTA